MELSILLTSHHRMLSVAAILDVFQSVNRYFSDLGKEPFFRIRLIYGEGEVKNMGYDAVGVHMSEVQRTDLVLVPAFASEDIRTLVEANLDLTRWLCIQHGQGVEIASFCTGSFLLAASGVLNGKKQPHILMRPRHLPTVFRTYCCSPGKSLRKMAACIPAEVQPIAFT